MTHPTHNGLIRRLRLPLLMAIAGGLLGGIASWALTWCIQESEEAKAEREAISAKLKQEYRDRPNKAFEPPPFITEQTPIGRYGQPSRTITKPRPGAYPEIPQAPYNPPLVLPVLGATIGFFGGWLKLNRQHGPPHVSKRVRRQPAAEPESESERRCERCGEWIPDGAGVTQFINQVHSPGSRYGPSSREVAMFLCESCGRLATDVSRIFWWTLAAFFAVLLLLIVLKL